MATANSQSPARTAREKSAAMRAQTQKQNKRKQILTQLGIVGVVAAIVLGITFIVLNGRDSAPAGAAPAGVEDNGSVIVGNADAPVTITLVEDFGCPACGAFEAQTGPLLEELSGGEDVKIEYRGIAFLDRAFSDEYSTRSLNASAVVATEAPDAWAEFHKLLFANQPAEGGAGLTDEQLIDFAVQAGAEEGDVRPGIENRVYENWTASTTDATLSLDGVEGTPSVFVNGEKVESTPDAISAAVEAALGE